MQTSRHVISTAPSQPINTQKDSTSTANVEMIPAQPADTMNSPINKP